VQPSAPTVIFRSRTAVICVSVSTGENARVSPRRMRRLRVPDLGRFDLAIVGGARRPGERKTFATGLSAISLSGYRNFPASELIPQLGNGNERSLRSGVRIIA